MTAIPAGPLVTLLRLVEGLPQTPENFRSIREITQGLNNILNILEKDDDE